MVALQGGNQSVQGSLLACDVNDGWWQHDITMRSSSQWHHDHNNDVMIIWVHHGDKRSLQVRDFNKDDVMMWLYHGWLDGDTRGNTTEISMRKRDTVTGRWGCPASLESAWTWEHTLPLLLMTKRRWDDVPQDSVKKENSHEVLTASVFIWVCLRHFFSLEIAQDVPTWRPERYYTKVSSATSLITQTLHIYRMRWMRMITQSLIPCRLLTFPNTSRYFTLEVVFPLPPFFLSTRKTCMPAYIAAQSGKKSFTARL